MSRFEEIIPVSSAKVAKIVSLEWEISALNMLYRVGARMLPWGTPALMCWTVESSSSYCTEKERWARKDLRSR